MDIQVRPGEGRPAVGEDFRFSLKQKSRFH